MPPATTWGAAVLAFGLVVLASAVPVLAVTAAGCRAYEFIAARGSGQSPQGSSSDYSVGNAYGMGDLLNKVFSDLDAAMPGQVQPYGVHYPAVSIWPGGVTDLGSLINGAGAFLHLKVVGSYTDSVRAGTADVQREIESVHATCADTRFILAGYSQGAQAVGDALQRMPAADRDLVAAAAFFGDPYFNARSWSGASDFDASRYGLLGVRDEWSESLHGKVFSYCHRGDPICNTSRRQGLPFGVDLYYRDPFGLSADRHGDYVAKGDASDAARRLARALGATPPTPTTTAPSDIVFAIDSTGSMGGIIAAVKANVSQLAETIASTSANFRFALVDFKDDPANASAYQARVDIGFTASVTDFTAAVATITATGGGDQPESLYAGVMAGLELPWRDGVRKSVIAITDAPGKDPEPVTGNTLEMVRAKALAVDPAQVYTVLVGGDPGATTSLTNLATATGGSFLASPDTSTFVTTLKAAIVAAGTAPQAAVGGPYAGIVGQPVTLSAAATVDPDEPVVAYDWDFDGDGTFDQTTADPVVEHTYPVAGSTQLVMRARAASGLAGTATATVVVAAPADAAPSAPAGLAAAAGPGSVTLTWTADPGVRYFTVRAATGAVLDRIAANNTAVEWRQDGLGAGTYAYTVTAGNERGEGPAAGPCTVTLDDATGPTTAPTSAVPSTTVPEPAIDPQPSSPAPEQARGALPTTGASVGIAFAVGAALVTAGAVLLMLARRRRRAEDRA